VPSAKRHSTVREALATIEATTIRFAILACHEPLSKIELNKAKIGTKALTSIFFAGLCDKRPVKACRVIVASFRRVFIARH
jgi:hypothetical protein